MNTREQIEELDRKALADMIKRRDLLNGSITQLEYHLANPPEPIDWNRVTTWVDEEMAKSKQMEERRYKELLTKEEEGTLSSCEQVLIKLYRGRRRIKEPVNG